MAGPPYRMGGLCSRHHWPVIAAWILVVVALALAGRAVGEQNSDNLSLPGTGSTRAQDLLAANLPNEAYGSNPVVLQAPSGKLTSGKNKQAVEDTVKSLKKQPAVIPGGQPAREEGRRRAQQGQDDRIHLGHPGRGTERPHQGGRPGDHRRDEPG
jgi:putative drug exporter of the RND superfamily